MRHTFESVLQNLREAPDMTLQSCERMWGANDRALAAYRVYRVYADAPDVPGDLDTGSGTTTTREVVDAMVDALNSYSLGELIAASTRAPLAQQGAEVVAEMLGEPCTQAARDAGYGGYMRHNCQLEGERACVLGVLDVLGFEATDDDSPVRRKAPPAPAPAPAPASAAHGLADSGAREVNETGGQREPEGDRGRFDLLPLEALQALAVHLGKGAAKYAPHNWRKGLVFSRCISSAMRHLLQFAAGREDEDHLAACLCNLTFLAQFRADIAAGRLPAELDDRFKL